MPLFKVVYHRRQSIGVIIDAAGLEEAVEMAEQELGAIADMEAEHEAKSGDVSDLCIIGLETRLAHKGPA